jgi:hypothetical protein
MKLRLAIIVAIAACGTSSPKGHEGQPGFGLPEGGAIIHDHIRVIGMPDTTSLIAYQYTSAQPDTAEFPMPGSGMFGSCVDERTTQTWPFAQIVGATFVTPPKVDLSGPGITGTLSIPESSPPAQVASWTERMVGISFGVNPSITYTPEMSTPGGDYTLDLGEGSPMTYHMPDSYSPPLQIGTANTVMFPRSQDLVLSWTPAPDDATSNDQQYTRKTYFNFTVFVDPNNATQQIQFMCFDDAPGHQVIPAAVLANLSLGGIIANIDMGFYMEERTLPSGEKRRFDLISTNANASLYQMQ